MIGGQAWHFGRSFSEVGQLAIDYPGNKYFMKNIFLSNFDSNRLILRNIISLKYFSRDARSFCTWPFVSVPTLSSITNLIYLIYYDTYKGCSYNITSCYSYYFIGKYQVMTFL